MSSSFDSLNLHVNVIPCPPPFSRSLTMKDWYWIRLVFWNYDYEMSNLDILHLDLCYLSRFIFISPQITSQAGTVAAQLRVEAEVCGEARRPCSEKWILKWICHILKACSACSSKVVGSLRFLVDPKVTTRCIALPNPFFAQSFRSGNVEMINSSKERLYKRRTVNCYILINTVPTIRGKQVYLSPSCRVSRPPCLLWGRHPCGRTPESLARRGRPRADVAGGGQGMEMVIFCGLKRGGFHCTN